MGPPILRIAHRGASFEAPENTLAALRRALDLGIDAIEVDVRLTADGVPVLLHDATLDRTTDGSGPLLGQPWAVVRRLDAGGWKDPGYVGEPVPTLREALELVRGRAVLHVEVKHPTPLAPVLEAVVAAHATGGCMIGSFDGEILRAARAQAPWLPTALISGGGSRAKTEQQTATAWVREVALQGTGCLSLNWQAVPGREAVRAFQRHGMSLWCWTVNDPAVMRRLAEWGVNAILTDDPAALNRELG